VEKPDPTKPTTDTTSIKRTLVEPNADEKRNGWTAKTLTKYLDSRERDRVLVSPPKLPDRQNHKYNPHRWRE
jgi:hypothetical protein